MRGLGVMSWGNGRQVVILSRRSGQASLEGEMTAKTLNVRSFSFTVVTPKCALFILNLSSVGKC